jgi:hypothetical protein
MSTEPRETDQPNEAGFAGDPTTPQPERDTRPAEDVNAEKVAVPGDDLTAPITQTLEGLAGHKDED